MLSKKYKLSPDKKQEMLKEPSSWLHEASI